MREHFHKVGAKGEVGGATRRSMGLLPILRVMPALKSMRSEAVVFPASTCAMMPKLRMTDLSRRTVQLVSSRMALRAPAGSSLVVPSRSRSRLRAPPSRALRGPAPKPTSSPALQTSHTAPHDGDPPRPRGRGRRYGIAVRYRVPVCDIRGKR